MHGIALKYFAEVAATGSLSAASERLFVAVSAISRQITKLEAQVGAPLFDRGPRGMVLSDAGQMLLVHARRTLLESEAVLHEIASLRGTTRGGIRIASVEGPAHGFLPGVIAGFRASHPHARFDLYVCSPAVGTRRVTDGESDLALTFNVEQSKGAVLRHAERAPVCAVMSTRHPLARQSQVTLGELAAYPIAIGGGALARKLLDVACQAENIVLEPALLATHSAALPGFVQDGMGIMLAGYISVADMIGPASLAIRPIDNPGLWGRTLQIQTMAGRVLPEIVEAFVSHLINVLNNLSASAGQPVGSARRRGDRPQRVALA
jgi:DNA-binding transcriptional LysR family regulator